MSTRQFVGLVGIAVVLALLAWFIAQFIPAHPQKAAAIASFEECAAAGYPIMESYPRQCAAAGKTFVEDIPSGSRPSRNGGMQFNGCAVAGCSGQLCVSAAEAENIVTTCEYRAAYACYREAVCEPQADDTCGWTMTAQLQQCLANPPSADENLQQI